MKPDARFLMVQVDLDASVNILVMFLFADRCFS